MDAVKPAAASKPRLPPGFRFRPTDVELIVHYLRRRALSAALPAAVDIPDIRILAHDPSDLLPPGWSEAERYFFTCKEAKYVKGRRANRATGAGYWKATGKEKPVAVAVASPPSCSSLPGQGGGSNQQYQEVLVGMKRSLVFYRGKPPSGSKTDWVMHEYRLAGAGLAPCRRRGTEPADRAAQQLPAEGWVLCRVFRKKSSSAGAASPARAGGQEEEEMEEEEQGREDGGDNAAQVEEEEESSSGFIDFFARADAARRRDAQRRASSPVVSSSCLTDEQQQQQCPREQETTSRGGSA